MAELLVTGIVAARDKQPYIQLSNENGMAAQLSMAQARNLCIDILQMCARSEADAMLVKFFAEHEFPMAACDALLIEFRDFRAMLDDEVIETSRTDPEEL